MPDRWILDGSILLRRPLFANFHAINFKLPSANTAFSWNWYCTKFVRVYVQKYLYIFSVNIIEVLLSFLSLVLFTYIYIYFVSYNFTVSFILS